MGFACHDATFRNFFGPTGVKLEVRKNGIGTGLPFACLEDMRQQGYGYAIVGGVGPTAFYSKAVGAVLYRRLGARGLSGGYFVAPVRNIERVIY